MAAFPQSGQKYGTDGNNLSTGDWIGSKNAMPIIIKTNNTQKAVFTSNGWFGLGIAAPSCMFDVFGDGKISNFNILSDLIVGNSLSTKKIFSPTGIVDFDGSKITTSNEIIAGKVTTPKIWSSSGTIDFDGCNLKTTAGITGASLQISGSGSFGSLTANSITTTDLSVTGTFSANAITSTGNLNLNNNNIINANSITANSFQSPLFAGANNGLILSDINGSFQKLNFDGNQNNYLRGDGTFGTLPELSLSDTIHAKVIIGDFINATKSIQLDGSITAGSRGSGTIGEYSIVVGGSEPMYGYATSPIASGKYSVSFGTANESSNLGSMSFGGGNVSSGLFSFAIGGDNISSGNLSVAIGSGNTVSGSNSTVIGKGNIVEGKQSAIIGGTGNTLNVDAMNSAIIGGTGISATQPNTVYVPNFVSNGNVGIGIESPIEKLDVNGNANIRGYLYVQDGVIIGKRIDGQRVTSDTIIAEKIDVSKKIIARELEAKTLQIEKVTADTLKTENMTLLLMQADSITALKMTLDRLAINDIYALETIKGKEINAELKVRSGQITIDGPGNKIYSSLGGINFNNNNLNGIDNFYANIISGGSLNVSKVTVDSSVVNAMQVVDELKIGNNSLHLSSSDVPSGDGTNIYSTNGSLKLQTRNGNTFHTIINAGTNNTGNVGIGTYNPHAKLDVEGDIRINNNEIFFRDFAANGNHGLGWYGDASQFGGPVKLFADENIDGPVLYGYNGGALASNQGGGKNIALRWLNNGYVGIGTTTPNTKLHVDGSIFMPDGQSLWIGNYTDNNNRLRIHHNGANAYIDYMPKLYFRSGNDPNMTNTVTFTDDGKVGIGTTSPDATLHVNGTLKLDLTGSHSNGDILTFDNTTGNAVWKTPAQQTEKWQTAVNANDIKFNGGNVGIGVSDPKATLHIDNSDNTASLRIGDYEFRQNQEPYSNLIDEDTYYNWTISNFSIGKYQPNGCCSFGYDEVLSITNVKDIHDYQTSTMNLNVDAMIVSNSMFAGSFYSSNTSYFMDKVGIGTLTPSAKLQVDGGNAIFNGNVGIGTTTPNAKLEVSDDINGFAGIRINNTNANDGGEVKVGIELFNNLNFHGQIYGERSTNNFVFRNCETVSGDIKFQTNNGSIEPLTIKHNGNVGIGTINPTAKLSVNGKILATEVEVIATVAPDYVFAPDYKLSTLQEIEKYIKQNSHLPDVPSAKDFEKDGQNLGEMNFILLKKVEELTLHLIELNKKIEALEKKDSMQNTK